MPARPRRRRVAAVVVLALVTSCLAGMATSAHAADTFVVRGLLTAEGKPVTGSWGQLHVARVFADGITDEVGEFHPDETGAFQFAVGSGTYRLYARVGGETLQGEWYDDALRLAEATPIVVTDTDVTLAAIDLEPPAVITGRVLDTAGSPLVGAGVGAYDTASDESLLEFERTDADGRFTLETGAGDWFVKVRGPHGGYLSEWHGDALDPAGARVVDVRRADVDLDPIVLEPAGQITGMVTWDDSNLDTTVDAVLHDLDGTPIEVVPVDQGERYTFDRLPAGRYIVGFEDPGEERELGNYPPPWLLREFFPDRHTWSEAEPVDVVAGTVTSGVDADLTLRPPPDLATAEISGTVSDVEGRPISRLTVSALSVASDLHQPVVSASATTDAQGRYRFANLDPVLDGSRDYVLIYRGSPRPPDDSAIDDFGWVTQWSGGAERYAGRQSLTVPESGGVVADATLRQHGTIEVRADPARADLDSGVRMTVVDEAGVEVATTRSWSLDTGAELRITGLAPDPYFLKFTGDAIPTTWWPGVPDREHATPISAPPGQVTRGLSIVLGDPPPPPPVLRSLTPPHVTGEPVVGGVLQVDVGTWSLDDVDHRVDWMVDGQVLRTARWMYPTSDLRGRRVSARLTTTHRPTGQEVVTDLPPVLVPRLASTATVSSRPRGQGKRGDRLELTLALSTADPMVDPVGEVVLLERGRVLSRAAAHRRVLLRLRGVAPGRHVYVIRYAGSTAIAPTETRIVVKVKKPRAGRGAG